MTRILGIQQETIFIRSKQRYYCSIVIAYLHLGPKPICYFIDPHNRVVPQTYLATAEYYLTYDPRREYNYEKLSIIGHGLMYIDGHIEEICRTEMKKLDSISDIKADLLTEYAHIDHSNKLLVFDTEDCLYYVENVDYMSSDGRRLILKQHKLGKKEVIIYEHNTFPLNHCHITESSDWYYDHFTNSVAVRDAYGMLKYFSVGRNVNVLLDY